MSSPILLRGCLVLLGFIAACNSTHESSAESPAKHGEGADSKSAPADAPKPAYPPAEELLARHVEVSGGADKIAQFETLYVETNIDTGTQMLKGTSKLWWKQGRFYLEDQIEGIGLSQIGFDGTTVWMSNPITPLRKLEGREAASYIQASSSMFPAHDWQKFYSKAETVGTVEVDGNQIWEVRLTSKAGPDTTIGLDAKTGLIRFQKTTQISPLGDTPFEVHSEDYREVLGYKFSFTNKGSVPGMLEITTVATKVEPNLPVDETKFTYPTERAVVPADPSAQPPVGAPGDRPE